MIVRFVLLTALISSCLLAQSGSARITGAVTDASGAFITGARITTTHAGPGAQQTVTTGTDGRFLTLPLRIGTYRVEVEADGFKRAVRPDIVLEIEQTQVLDFQLQLGATSESVSVTAEVPLLSTVDATQGQ